MTRTPSFLILVLFSILATQSAWANKTSRANPSPTSMHCPDLQSGTNTLALRQGVRKLDIYLPAITEKAPVLFIWHGLRDKPANMARWFGSQNIADGFGAVVVIPHSSGQFPRSEWGFAGDDNAVDARFFDGALTCLAMRFEINPKRVYTTGFSAGALWSTWLLMHRSDRIAAAALFSGGAGGFLPYTAPKHKRAVLAIHGGRRDVFGGYVDFSKMTSALVEALRLDGQTVIQCDHGAGHRIPFRPDTFALPFLFAQAQDRPVQGGPPGAQWPAFCTRG